MHGKHASMQLLIGVRSYALFYLCPSHDRPTSRAPNATVAARLPPPYRCTSRDNAPPAFRSPQFCGRKGREKPGTEDEGSHRSAKCQVRAYHPPSSIDSPIPNRAPALARS